MTVSYVSLGENRLKPVKISKNEALAMQYELLSNWESQSDLWGMKWGRAFLAAANGISSIVIMNHYRKKLKLLHYGRLIMFFPGVVIPSFVTPIFHQTAVVEPLLLGPQCAVCLQVRSALIQGTASVAYPILVNSISAFLLANTFATYRLPTFAWSYSGELFSIWKKLTAPLSATLPFHILAQVIVSFVITEIEAKSFFTVQEKLVEKLKASQNS